MFEGDLVEGELEIGQASAMIKEILPASAIVQEMMRECRATMSRLSSMGE